MISSSHAERTMLINRYEYWGFPLLLMRSTWSRQPSGTVCWAIRAQPTARGGASTYRIDVITLVIFELTNVLYCTV